MPYKNKEDKAIYELARYHRRRNAAIKRMGGKCQKCGSKSNLEFDHIDPNKKLFAVSSFWSRSIDVIEKELKKCQLLCKSCHKKKTFEPIRKQREHGSYTMYKRGKCRCRPCIKAKREKDKEYKLRYRRRQNNPFIKR